MFLLTWAEVKPHQINMLYIKTRCKKTHGQNICFFSLLLGNFFSKAASRQTSLTFVGFRHIPHYWPAWCFPAFKFPLTKAWRAIYEVVKYSSKELQEETAPHQNKDNCYFIWMSLSTSFAVDLQGQMRKIHRWKSILSRCRKIILLDPNWYKVTLEKHSNQWKIPYPC